MFYGNVLWKCFMNPGKCRNPEQLQIQTERREDGKREKRG